MDAHARSQFYMEIPDLWQGVRCINWLFIIEVTKYHRAHVNERWTSCSNFSLSHTVLLADWVLNCCNTKWGTNKHRSSQYMEVIVILVYWTQYPFRVQPSKVYVGYGLVNFFSLFFIHRCLIFYWAHSKNCVYNLLYS